MNTISLYNLHAHVLDLLAEIVHLNPRLLKVNRFEVTIDGLGTTKAASFMCQDVESENIVIHDQDIPKKSSFISSIENKYRSYGNSSKEYDSAFEN
jgi:hypothetical protein